MTERPPMTRARARFLLEQSREDAAVALNQTFETQRALHAVLGLTDELWPALLGEEAPELEMTRRVG